MRTFNTLQVGICQNLSVAYGFNFINTFAVNGCCVITLRSVFVQSIWTQFCDLYETPHTAKLKSPPNKPHIQYNGLVFVMPLCLFVIATQVCTCYMNNQLLQKENIPVKGLTKITHEQSIFIER